MSDIKIFSNNMGYLSLHDSAQDILNRFIDRDDVTVENDGEMTVIKNNSKDSEIDIELAFLSDDSGVKLIDMCASTTDRICIGNEQYTIKDFKEKFSKKDNAFAVCEVKGTKINPYDVHRECNTICAKNNLECYLNCSMCGELRHKVCFKEYNAAITYLSGSDDTMVYIERLY